MLVHYDENGIMVVSSRACMPSRCWGGSNYYRIAAIVLESPDGPRPRLISLRCRNVRDVHVVAERAYLGARGWDGDSAAAHALRRAMELARSLAQQQVVP